MRLVDDAGLLRSFSTSKDDLLEPALCRGTVAYGTTTGAKGWTLRAEHLSGRYTTRWGDLLAV